MAGNKETVTRAIEKAERFRTELVKRGVILAPVIWGENRKASLERKGFGLPAKAATSLPSIGVRSFSLILNMRIFYLRKLYFDLLSYSYVRHIRSGSDLMGSVF